ncbi:quinolinate synthase NadA [Methanotrichaceae archaeon M04Ac]|uniref:Quinolinate synthase n=1 Tax=Candidatus Methanocrinis alkalitolerans TaxID=3033395 RepID=A0ABT5XEF4_9EURY|nr:quinolinate synthase NadA [Candidatus Methanocrinis alkalitolerans]MCR3883914.1 quinolinate synthase NadA [Methanothrix sp.]MDF0593084.1 quinolinate synthase NadA [Candidatus Methanocrinis alkalitolerans]
MLADDILRLKEEKNAVILAHNYQPGDVQDVADLRGDSLELSRAAAREEADLIVFCGVDFMAETAAILSPEKRVILSGAGACCPMAQMITGRELRGFKAEHPAAAVVCYVNSSAEVKAESDICCTSANGIEVVASLSEETVLFVPDRNLGRYVARFTDKKIIPWDGYCYVHDRYTTDDVLRAKSLHPEAEVLVHPECRPEVIDLADGVYSTSGMARRALESPAREFIIGTEVGMNYRLKKDNPGKEFYPLSEGAICVDMKKTTLEKVLSALVTLEPRVVVPKEIADRARGAIERMLEV